MIKNVNLALIGMVVVTIAAFAATTTYFEGELRETTQNFEDKSNEARNLTAELNAYKDLLNTTESSLLLKESREQDLSQQYLDIREQKNTLEQEKATLSQYLAEKTQLYLDTRSELAVANADLARTQVLLDDAEADLASCEDDYDECEEDLEACLG